MRARIDPHGFDAGKKIKGKKRHLLVDTQSLVLHAIVHAADIQDRDGGVLVMATLFGMSPFLLKLYAERRLSGTAVPGRLEACRSAGQRRDREAIGRGQGVHCSTQAMDCRGNDRLAQ
jgi:hypothetical protein